MNVTVRIHPSWLSRPESLRAFLAATLALESEYSEHVAVEPADRGDAWEPPGPEPPATARRNGTAAHADVESPPRDGRELLGWAAKQVPDQKAVLLALGKKKGWSSKVLSWTAEQVEAAYEHARKARANQWGGAPQ